MSLLQSNLVNTDTQGAILIDLLQVDLTSLASEVSFFLGREAADRATKFWRKTFEKSKGAIESVPINGGRFPFTKKTRKFRW